MPLTSLSGLRPLLRLRLALRYMRRARRSMPWLTAVWLALFLGGINLAAWAGVADRLPGDLAIMCWI